MSGWISVKERLPEPDVRVLMSNGLSVFIAKWNERKGRFESSDGVGLFWAAQPTHWQPLPPPPGQEPQFKPGDKVIHVDYPDYGVGIVEDVSKSGKRAYVRFPDYDQRRYCHAPRAYYTPTKLRPAPKEEEA